MSMLILGVVVIEYWMPNVLYYSKFVFIFSLFKLAEKSMAMAYGIIDMFDIGPSTTFFVCYNNCVQYSVDYIIFI